MKPVRLTNLDGLRGLAALAVVVFHAARMFLCANIAPRGYLAVDFFFVLSGFVLARAYDGRIGATLTAVQFMRGRFLRLAPLFWVGVGLGTLAFLTAPGIHVAAGQVLLATIANLLLLPFPLPVKIDLVFPMNPPGWSLFFELWVANALFAFVGPRTDERRLLAMLALFTIMLVIALRYFGGNTGAFVGTFACGLPRVLFSFFAGVFLYRVRDRVPAIRLPQGVLAGILLLSLLPGFQGGVGKIYDLVCITMLYPAIVMAGSVAEQRWPRLNAWFGDLSYALYCIHYPVLQLLADHWLGTFQATPVLFWLALALLTVTAWALQRVFDRRCQNLIRSLQLARAVSST